MGFKSPVFLVSGGEIRQVSSASDCVVKLCDCSQLMVKLEPCFLCLCQEEESSGCIFFTVGVS